jgi:hypothetical protein
LDNQAVNGVLEHKSVFTLLRDRVNQSSEYFQPSR